MVLKYIIHYNEIVHYFNRYDKILSCVSINNYDNLVMVICVYVMSHGFITEK